MLILGPRTGVEPVTQYRTMEVSDGCPYTYEGNSITMNICSTTLSYRSHIKEEMVIGKLQLLSADYKRPARFMNVVSLP